MKILLLNEFKYTCFAYARWKTQWCKMILIFPKIRSNWKVSSLVPKNLWRLNTRAFNCPPDMNTYVKNNFDAFSGCRNISTQERQPTSKTCPMTNSLTGEIDKGKHTITFPKHRLLLKGVLSRWLVIRAHTASWLLITTQWTAIKWRFIEGRTSRSRYPRDMRGLSLTPIRRSIRAVANMKKFTLCGCLIFSLLFIAGWKRTTSTTNTKSNANYRSSASVEIAEHGEFRYLKRYFYSNTTM